MSPTAPSCHRRSSRPLSDPWLVNSGIYPHTLTPPPMYVNPVSSVSVADTTSVIALSDIYLPIWWSSLHRPDLDTHLQLSSCLHSSMCYGSLFALNSFEFEHLNRELRSSFLLVRNTVDICDCRDDTPSLDSVHHRPRHPSIAEVCSAKCYFQMGKNRYQPQ